MNGLSKRFTQSAGLASASIVVLSAILYWLGPSSTWETNDDVYYNLIFAGKLLTSAPDAHTVMVNYVLSTFFTKVYTFFPAVPWYGVFHVTAIWSALFFLNYCYALARDNDKFALRMAVSLSCALPFLFHLQFTKTSVVLGVAGYLGLYLLNEASLNSRRQSLLLHAVAAAFLVLSFALRNESFYLATVLCGLLVGRALLQKKRELMCSLAAAAVLIGLFAAVHKLNYGADWDDFFAVGKLSGPILNYGQYGYDANRQVYDEVGWSRNDYYLFRSWGYSDDKIYSRERIEYIVDHATATTIERSLLRSLQGAADFPARNYLLVLAVLALFMLVVFRRNYLVLTLCVVLPFLVCVGVLAWQGRFPTRVSTAMAYVLPWLILVQSGGLRNRLATAVGAVVALGVMVVPAYGQVRDLSALAQYRKVQNQELKQLGALVAKSPIKLVTLGASFPYEGILPFESPDYLSGASIVWLCGMNQSPLQKRQLQDLQIRDPYLALTTDASAYIVLSPMEVGILKKYILEHYQKLVSVTPVYAGSSFQMYRLAN